MEPQYFFGKHPIEELLASDAGRISKLYIQENLKSDDTLRAIISKAKDANLTIVQVPKAKLDQYANDGNHQGIVALVQQQAFTDIKEWLAGRKSRLIGDQSGKQDKNELVVVLDELEDPHNVGAIIRTATAGGASAIIFGARRQAPITGTVFKASAGTLGKIPLIEVSNINDSVRKLKDAGFWIASLEAEGKDSLFDAKLDGSFAIIVGAEGKGVRQKTGELADFTISIPMENNTESLNASVAAALLIYEWNRKN